MMTLTQAERVVRKIGELVGHPAPETQTAKLAQDYAEFCRAASRRLEQCALMIEAGQSLQALQLAETPPPLLDLVAILSFRQAADWRKYCQTHNLPWSEPFYDKHVRLLNSAYGKGIAGDHPFYRDYRRAVMKGDDPRALSILRVIARLNPSDENTAAELKRLEEKLLRVKLDALSDALGKGDIPAALSLLAQIEASGLPLPVSHPVWQRVQVARCQQLLRRAEALRQEAAWQEAESLVNEIHALANQYNVQLPDAETEAWNVLEEWTANERGAFAEEQDFQRALAGLAHEVEISEARRAGGVAVNLPEAQAAIDTLAAKWQEAERFGRPLDKDLVERCHECNRWLRKRTTQADRRRRILLAAVVLVLLGAGAAAIPFFKNWMRQSDTLAQLDELRSKRQVGKTVEFLQRLSASDKAYPRTAAGVAQAQQFIARESALTNACNRALAALPPLDAQGFRDVLDLSLLRRKECEQAVAALAPEFQAAPVSRLAAWDAQWQAARNRELDNCLNRADQAAAGLSRTSSFESVRGVLPDLQAALAAATNLLVQPPTLDAALADRFRQLTAKAGLWTDQTGHWERINSGLGRVSSTEEYLDLLNQLASSPFASTPQRDAVDRVSRLKISDLSFLGQLLLPTNQEAWGCLTNLAAWPDKLLPEQPTDPERRLYLELRDDPNMREVYAFELQTNTRPGNPFRTHVVFSRGLIALDRGGQQAGIVYDWTESHDNLRFYQHIYSDWDYVHVKKLNRTVECDTYERLGLGDLIDPNTGIWQKPLLPLLDQLNQDDKASAIFRAFVFLKLYALAQMRPLEWGLQWAPGVQREAKALKELGAEEFKSGDWMIRAQMTAHEDLVQAALQSLRTVPFEKQAKLFRQLTRATCSQDFAVAGYVDVTGVEVLRPINVPRAEFWGWDARSGSVTRLFQRAGVGRNLDKLADPVPYTPLKVFLGDRRDILREALEAIDVRRDTVGQLPPFFSDL